jgi:hypothetical protein
LLEQRFALSAEKCIIRACTLNLGEKVAAEWEKKR